MSSSTPLPGLKSMWKSLLRSGNVLPPSDPTLLPSFLQALTTPSPPTPPTPQKPRNSMPEMYSVALVAFHHTKGSQIEFQYPNESEMSDLVAYLALPDCAHNEEKGYTCFTLSIAGETKYAAARFWHTANPSPSGEMSRNYIQRSIVLIANSPHFEFLLHEADTAMSDFTLQNDPKALKAAFDSACERLQSAKLTDLTEGLTLFDLAKPLRSSIVSLWKLILLESRIIVYSSSASTVASGVLGLISLFPGQLCFSRPDLLPETLKSTLRGFALPLDLFYEGYLFRPSVSLVQVEDLMTTGYVAGSTNLFIAEGRCGKHNVIVDLDKGTLRVSLGDGRRTAAELSKGEREFGRQIALICEGNPASAAEKRLISDRVRTEFHTYLKTLLSTLALIRACFHPDSTYVYKAYLKPYRLKFLMRWTRTHNFQAWRDVHDPAISRFSPHSPAVLSSSIYYENGDYYLGDLCNGQRHGHGQFHQTPNQCYDGQWANDQRHGFGEYKDDEELYRGDWCEDQRTGSGEWTGAEGHYCGELVCGVRQGRGRMEYTGGGVYEGEWCAGNRHGTGRMITVQGDVYEGEFVGDQYDGQGQLTYVSGTVYTGHFHSGLFHGIGHLSTPSTGITFHGSFDHGIPSGPGSTQKPDGCVVNGYYEDGELVYTSCEVCWADGRVYRGPVDEGLNPCGDGYVSMNGKEFVRCSYSGGVVRGKKET